MAQTNGTTESAGEYNSSIQIQANKVSSKAKSEFDAIMQSKNNNSEIPTRRFIAWDKKDKITTQGIYSNDAMKNTKPTWTVRTKDDRHNLDPLAKTRISDSESIPLDLDSTDFYKNKPILNGGMAYYNNETAAYSDQSPYSDSTPISQSAQPDHPNKPSANCDALGYGLTGGSGSLYVNATGMLTVTSPGVQSQLLINIYDKKGSLLDSFKSSKLTSVSEYWKAPDPTSPYYESDNYDFFRRSQYTQQNYNINQTAHVFRLNKPYEVVKICIQQKYTSNAKYPIWDVNKINQNRLDFIKTAEDRWLQQQKRAGNNTQIGRWVHHWQEQYKVWARALLVKYVDYSWVGI
ncbi:hypothetical protein [Photobacterium damselae]|uniref:hypothetical protein n=1 Tax=Photobacterium damselae TaxID=38293 RepID=UPI004068480F